jgi:hypothetical protein
MLARAKLPAAGLAATRFAAAGRQFVQHEKAFTAILAPACGQGHNPSKKWRPVRAACAPAKPQNTLLRSSLMSAVPHAAAGAPVPSFSAVTLDDKYLQTHGRVYLTGTQALVRLPMIQRQRDLAAGLNTAGFISGYRGSPLGTYDQALWKAKRFLRTTTFISPRGE